MASERVLTGIWELNSCKCMIYTLRKCISYSKKEKGFHNAGTVTAKTGNFEMQLFNKKQLSIYNVLLIALF